MMINRRDFHFKMGVATTEVALDFSGFQRRAQALTTHDEDTEAAGFYRFLPKRNQHIAEGGTLHMLKMKDKGAFDTRKGLKTGQRFASAWVTIDDPDPVAADLDESAVYKHGLEKGAATFARLEGAYPDIVLMRPR